VLFTQTTPKERACWSDDAKVNYGGIPCASCPHVSEEDSYKAYYAHPDRGGTLPPKPWLGGTEGHKCSFRYIVEWHTEFIPVQGGGAEEVEHEAKVQISCPKSSIYALFGRDSYTAKLSGMGTDITKVVTRIKAGSRKDKQFQQEYKYPTFEFLDTVENARKRVVGKRVVKADSEQASAAASLPTATGAAAPAPAAGFSPTAFGPAQAAGFPPAQPVGSPFGASTQPFPAAAPGAYTAPAAGFPAATGPAPVANVAPAPAPAFADFARQELGRKFGALPENIRRAVLNVLGVQSLDQVPQDKLAQANDAVAQAQAYVGGPAAAPPAQAAAAPRPAGAPF